MVFPGATFYRKNGNGAPSDSGIGSVGAMSAAAFDPSLYEAQAIWRTGHAEPYPAVDAQVVSAKESLPDTSHDLPSLTLLAKNCADSGELEQARRWTDAAIAADKCDASLRYLLAVILDEQGHFSEAIASLQRALYLDPDFVLAHFALGGLRLRDGQSVEAKRHYDCVLRLLARLAPTDIVPESDGLTADRLMQIVRDKENVL
jgi:chemotaxis protein methyltransferase CheR